jgi:hypothetical protein
MVFSKVIGSGDKALCEAISRVIEAGGVPIIKPKHGTVEWYKEGKVLVIPWGVAEKVEGGFVTDLSKETVERIVRAPRGAKTRSIMDYCSALGAPVGLKKWAPGPVGESPERLRKWAP